MPTAPEEITANLSNWLRKVAYMRVAAQIARSYYESLLAEGFNTEQAERMTTSLQASIINAIPSLLEHLPPLLEALPSIAQQFDSMRSSST